MALLQPPSPTAVQEVDTEYEEEHEEAHYPDPPAEEVVEEWEAAPSEPASTSATTDYAVPEENRDVWKNFGCDTEAGRMLRRLYGGMQQKEMASRVSYPRLVSPARRLSEPKAPPPKPCPQRAVVQVPRPMARRVDPDDPKNWRAPLPGRKPASIILAEMEAGVPKRPDLPSGRDQAAEKRSLQDRFRYGGGQALPPGAMGNVPKGEMPPARASSVGARRKEQQLRHQRESGMTAEQREIFQELTLAVKSKQARLAELDAADAAEKASGQKPSKASTERNKEALQLQNDIESCVRGIDTLLSITEDA